MKITESRLRRIIREAVKSVVNEAACFGNNGQMTVGELEQALSEYGGKNERVEVFDGKNTNHCVYAFENGRLFLSEEDYENHKRRGEEYAQKWADEHDGRYGGGEGLGYGPSDMPAGWQ